MSESQYVGSVVGLAVGDALGYPAEFRKRAQILQEIGPEGISDFIALQHPPEEVLVDGALGEGWVAEEAVASALYCYWRHPDDYVKAVLTAVNTDGDSDSLATITGSILGARLGIESIPEDWRNGVEDSQYLHLLGQELWRKGKAKAAIGMM